MMWFAKLIRQFFFMIDSIVYNGIIDIYRLLIDISRTSVLSQSSIQSIATRIYELLAIFMIFKIIFSLIMYVVNPDDFSDKSKGVSKIGINIVISLSLLVLTPYIFSYAFQLQNIILEDNSLGTIIFGESDSNTDSSFSVFNSAGGDIAFYTMKPFFLPNATISDLRDCTTMEVDGVFNKECSGIDFELEDDDQYTGDKETMAGLTQDDSKKANFKLSDVKNYVYGVEKSNLALMFRSEMALATAMANNETTDFIIDYKFMFSTPIGIIVVLLLISFCMDVALRSVKLAFLQLIAPIPILSYIDPKSGKDGMFKKWYEMCFKTFASLFVRLLALYFAIFIITKIDRMTDILTGAYQSSAWVNIFVIIGTLMFAKQLPKILEGLGIKLDGDGKFTLNPLKKFGEEAAGGKKILGFGAAGAAAGAAFGTNLASRMFHPNSWRDSKGRLSFKEGLKNMAKAPGSAFGGAASAMWRGSKKAMKEESIGKVFGDSYGEAMFAKLQREDLGRQGSTFGGRVAADFNRKTGNLNAAQNQELWAAQAEQEHKANMQSLKDQKDNLERRKSNLAKRKRDATDKFSKRQLGYEGMKDTIDGYVNKQKTFETTEQVWDKQQGRYVDVRRNHEYNVKDALERKQKLMDTGGYTVKIGDKIAERDSQGRMIYDPNGEIKMRTATAKDVEDGVKTDEAIAVEAEIKRQQKATYEYLTSSEGKETADGQRFAQNQQIVESTGETVADSYDDIKIGAINAGKELKVANGKFAEEESTLEAEGIAISDKEAAETDRYIDELKDLNLDKDSVQWKTNEADHKARKIGSGQKQPEGFSPSAENAYTARNTNFLLGSGPDGGSGGPGGPGGPPPTGGGPS